MTRWLIDANALSELRRPRPAPKVFAFIAAQPLESLFVSVVTFAEIRFGVERVDDAGGRAELNDWLNRTLRPMFGQRTSPVSEDVMFKRRRLVEQGRKARHTFSQPNLVIAATALCYGLTVVNRDADECERARAPVFNPWRGVA